MGSFDGWSRGVTLSACSDASDGTFHRFEGTLHARKVGADLLVKCVHQFSIVLLPARSRIQARQTRMLPVCLLA